MKFVKVDDCKTCPFCGYMEPMLETDSPNFCMVSDNRDIPLNDDYELIGSPEWCPLDSEPICVSKHDYSK